MNPDDPRQEAIRREVERAELETKIRLAIAKNQEALNAVPEDVTGAEYWNALHREGAPRALSVSRLEGDAIDTQPEIYLLHEEGGQVEVTYFRDDGEIGESFWIAMERIKAIE